MRNSKSYEPDGKWRDVWVEVKPGMHGSRNLRADLLEFSYRLASHPDDRGLLVLLDSRITEKRLQDERQLAAEVIRPDVMRRLTLASARGGRYLGLPPDLGEGFQTWLEHFVSKASLRGKSRGSFYAILEILLHNWLLGEEPITHKSLGQMAGCSYPTVAAALRRLEPYLRRQSSRCVELKSFPRDEWARLLAVADHVRETTGFSTSSAPSSSPEAYLRRLEKLDAPDLAIGGVLGTRHYHPDLDLVGTPRLDLSLHCPGRKIDFDFVQKLDPALQPVTGALQPANVVVHIVRRAEAFFVPRRGGLQWADPVECLMDLHEAHLEQQAKEFLRYLEERRSTQTE